MEKKDIFQVLAALREKYPEDVDRINLESDTLRELLMKQNYSEQEGSKRIVSMCREQMAMAQRKLATDKSLVGNEPAQRDLWLIIESRQWILQFMVTDYKGQIEDMRDELLKELE